MKTPVDRFIEWGVGRSHRPWRPGTVRAYESTLRVVEREMGKAAESLTADDLRTFQASHRAEAAASWNRRVSIIEGFYEYLGAQGYFQELTPEGDRRVSPVGVLKKRPVERKARPLADVRTAIEAMDEPYKSIALFLYHSGLKIGQACSIDEPPVGGHVHVESRGGSKEWVPLRQEALDLLSRLGGRIPYKPRAIQKNFSVTPSEIEAAARRDHQLRTGHEDALGPVWALLINRPALRKVAHSYRDAVEAMEGPKPQTKDAITAAARALQEMLRAMGAQGNSLGPLFHDARGRGLFGPHDSRLASAMNNLVDWVSADRSQRGSAHVDTVPRPEDGWLAIRVVGALLLRLEAAMP